MDAQQTIADLITEHGLEETLQAFADAVVNSDEDDSSEIALALVEIMDDFYGGEESEDDDNED